MPLTFRAIYPGVTRLRRCSFFFLLACLSQEPQGGRANGGECKIGVMSLIKPPGFRLKERFHQDHLQHLHSDEFFLKQGNLSIICPEMCWGKKGASFEREKEA